MCFLRLHSRRGQAIMLQMCASPAAAMTMARQLDRILVSGLGSAAWPKELDGLPNLEYAPVEGKQETEVPRRLAEESADGKQAPSVDALHKVLASYGKRELIILVEFEYFDLDYRSEFSATHETAFGVRRPACSRIHLFTPRSEDPGASTLRGAVQTLRDQYVGYVIVRPQFPGTIGRSILAPAGPSRWTSDIPDDVASGLDLSGRVRSAAREYLELMGVPLSVVGVPFMEQDGHLLRCAHVAAWMAHYTAVLRGTVPRRTSASFHLAEDDSGAYGRRYPSAGLSTGVLARILRRLDLPPEVLEFESLQESRELRWYDRPALRSYVLALNPKEVMTPLLPTAGAEEMAALSAPNEEKLNELWVRENLTSNICRYLNSGIPVVLAEDRLEHMTVACGYLRGSDVPSLIPAADEMPAPAPAGPVEAAAGDGEASALNPNSGVVGLVVQDDQGAPYELKSINSIIDEASAGDVGFSLVVPLPRGLWMSGQTAEAHGAELFQSLILKRHAVLPKWIEEHGVQPDDALTLTDSYERLVQAVSQDSGTHAIRSFVTISSQFKVSYAARVNDETAADVLGLTRLPKFVWVIELVDRNARDLRNDTPFVEGTVLLDASIVEESDDPEEFASPLFVHLPGQVSAISGPYTSLEWFRTALGPYRTGRWDLREGPTSGGVKPLGASPAEALAMAWKGAVAAMP